MEDIACAALQPIDCYHKSILEPCRIFAPTAHMAAPLSWTAEMWQDFLVFLNGEDVEAEDFKDFPPSDIEAVLADFMAQQGVTPLRAAKLKKALRETLEIALPQQVGGPGASGGEASPVRRASPKSLAALPIQAPDPDTDQFLEPAVPSLRRLQRGSAPFDRAVPPPNHSRLEPAGAAAAPTTKSPPARQRVRPRETLLTHASASTAVASPEAPPAVSPAKRPRAGDSRAAPAASRPAPPQVTQTVAPASLATKPMADFHTPIGRKNLHVLGRLYKLPVKSTFSSKDGRKQWAKFSLYLEDATGTRGEVQLKHCNETVLPPDTWLGQEVVVGPIEVRAANPLYNRQGKCFDGWTKLRVYLATAINVSMPLRPEPQMATCHYLQPCNVGISVSVHGVLHALNETITEADDRVQGTLLVADESALPLVPFHLIPVTFWRENVSMVAPDNIGEGLMFGDAVVTIYRGITRLEAEKLTEISVTDAPQWARPADDAPLSLMLGANDYSVAAMDPVLSVAAALQAMPDRAFFLEAVVDSVDIREFHACPHCKCRAERLDEPSSEYECTSCSATFEDAVFTEFANVQLMDASGSEILEASAWDRMCEVIRNLQGETVALKVTQRLDNHDLVSIDHIQLLQE